MAAISLDGKIAKSPEDKLGWTGRDDKRWFAKVSSDAGAIIMGRRAYEVIGRPLAGRLIKVMSRQAENFLSIPGQVEFTSHSPKEILGELGSRGFERVIIGGGREIYSLFVEENLVDEVWLSVIPIILGRGITWVELKKERQLDLVGMEGRGEGGIVAKYRVQRL